MMGLYQTLERAEDRRYIPYKDDEGLWTIGIGRLIDQTKGGGLHADEIELFLKNKTRITYPDSERYSYQECPEFWSVPLTDAEIDYLLANDVTDKTIACVKLFPDFYSFKQSRQDALIELMFNLGYGHLSAYHTFVSQVNAQDWAAVQRNMRGWTRWFSQVKDSRANRIINELG
jgi:GH24 family phage-related lysozyme (muramidase)